MDRMINIIMAAGDGGFDPGVATLLTIVLLIAMAGIIVLLFFGIKKDRVKIAMLKEGGSGDVDTADFKEYIKMRCRSPRSGFVVFLISLSDVKNIIESCGKKSYEFAIKKILNKLKKAFPEDTRFSVEDGKLYILTNNRLDEEAQKMLANASILETTSTIPIHENMSITFDVSAAVVAYSENNKTLEQFETNLKYMLAQSERKGLNQYSIYVVGSSDTDSDEYKTYVEVKSAIENKEFELYYQGMYDLVTGDSIGYESLLRWNHRTMGVLPPSTFLNILDTSGDINWVGVWAFEQMLLQHIAWQKQAPDKTFFLSMNLSSKQLMNEKLVPELRQVVKKFKVTPNNMCMEIAEYAFLQKGTISDNIDALAQSGFMIAIDNYSMEMNIAALDKHKIDVLKIERDFIGKIITDDGMSRDMLKLIITYAKKRNIRVVAEGVEDENVVVILRDNDIRFGQGYNFGKPQAAEKIKINV